MNTAESIISPDRIEQAIRQRYSPFPTLTMDVLTQQLNQFRIGELRPFARTAEIMMERDGDLSVPAEKLFSDIARLPIEVVKAEDSKEAEAHAASLQYFIDNLTARSVLDGDEIGGSNLLLRQMMTAHAYRYSVHEMVLKINSASKREVTAEFNHAPVWFFEARKGRLGYLRGDYDLYGVPLERGQWLTCVGRGMMRQCSVAYLGKWQATAYNLLFCFRFGVPGIHGEFNGEQESEEGKAFAESLAKFASDWVTATYGAPGSAKINLIEAAKGGSGTLPFAEVIERADRLFARSFRGGDLSTQSRGGTGGDVTGSDAQEGEKRIVLEDGGQWATDNLNAGVVEPLIAYLYNATPKAWLVVRPPKQTDSTREGTTLKTAQSLGIPVSVDTARERLDLPAPEEGAKLISGPQTSAPGPFGDPALANDATHLQEQFAREIKGKVDLAGSLINRITAIENDDTMMAALREFYARTPQLTALITADVQRASAALELITAPALKAGLEGKKP